MTLRIYWRLTQPIDGQSKFLNPTIQKEQKAASQIGWMMIILGVALAIIFPFLVFLLGLVLFLGYLLMPVTNTLRILNWILQSSSDLAKMRQQNIYEILALTPYGALGVAWFTQRGVLYKQNRLPKSASQRAKWAAYTLIVAIVTVGTYALFEGRLIPESVFQFAGFIAALIAIYLCDFAQSTALGCVLAMLIPTYIHRGLEARVFSGAVFLLFQVSAYIVLLAAAIILLKENVTSGDSFQTAIYTVRLSLLVLVFYAFREISTHLLQRWLLYRLNASQDEWNALLRGAL